MGTPLRLLVLESDQVDPAHGKRLCAGLQSLPYACTALSSLDEALQALRAAAFDVILISAALGSHVALAILALPIVAPIIIVAGHGEEAILAQALQSGAYDYVFKDPDDSYLTIVPLIVERAIRRKQTEDAWRLVRPEKPPPSPAPDPVGREQPDRPPAPAADTKAEFAHAIGAVPDGVVIVAPHLPDQPIIYVNPAFERLTGYRADQVLGQNCRFLQGPSTDPATVAEIRRCLEERRAFAGEILNYRADGRPFWNELRISPVFAESGELISYIGIQTDITQRKLDAAALRASEARFQALARISPVGIFRTDAIGECIYVNERWCQISGLAPEQAYGYGWAQTIHPDDRPMIIAEWVRLAHDQGYAQIEHRFVRPDGQIIWALGQSAAEYDRDGTLVGHVGTITDITAQKQAEAALKSERALLAQRVAERTADLSAANVELAKAARTKDEFLANMSHELRTPLTAILGLSEVLIEEISGPLNQQQHETLLTIEQSGRHLLALINDILDLSKIEAGRLDLVIEEIPIDQFSEASLLFIRQQAMLKAMTVTFTIDPPEIVMQTDERRIKQILVNLLNNAVKFTPDHGTIGLDVRGDSAGGMIHFTVWDTGIGIAPKDLELILQPFIQLDRRLSRQYEGTGLGLSLVLRLTDLLGGSLAIESREGQGSRFTVSLPIQTPLPAARPIAPPPAATPPPAAQLDGRHVLLVEDNQAIIDLLKIYLNYLGLQISVARSGTEAITLAHATSPDLILMDIQMPEMDGIAAIGLIRAEPSCAAIPIVAITALVMPGDRARCLSAGAQAYLSKPLNLAELRAVIEELFATA